MKVNNTIRVFYSLILTVIFLLPSMVQLEHLIDGHEHDVCQINSEHVHEIKSNCEINDFQFTPFQYDPHTSHELLQSIAFSKEESFYDSIDYHTSKSPNKKLRAPPYFS